MRPAINAAGHLSALGGSVLSPAVRRAMSEAGRHYTDVRALQAAVEVEAARLAGAEAACVTAGAAAGMAIAVAACLTRGETDLVGSVPDLAVERREVVVQAGHLIDFGATVEQMVRLGGGRPVAAGSREAITPAELEAAFGPRTACLLYVQSHHTRGNASLELPACVGAARLHGAPVIVDAAAEEDLSAYVALGADLAIYSGTKAIGAPVSGLILGREPYVGWCRAQARGIARTMKVGKEQAFGLLAALREYAGRDPDVERRRQERLLRRLEGGLGGLPGVGLERVDDEAGRPIQRLGLRLASATAARALHDSLVAGDPPVYTRPHRLNEGLVQLDPRGLRPRDCDAIIGAMRALAEGGRKAD
jgi:L-seryl-tRNA(Ser) seleniumtransferase/D-glucosaminate-6-phosphate ammonia-lyase